MGVVFRQVSSAFCVLQLWLFYLRQRCPNTPEQRVDNGSSIPITPLWMREDSLLRNHSIASRPQRRQRPLPLNPNSEIILSNSPLGKILPKTPKQFFLGLVKFAEKLYPGQGSFYSILWCRHMICPLHTYYNLRVSLAEETA